MNLLALIQQACGEMGLTVPAAVAGNTTQDVVTQLALLNSVGSELVREHEWQALTKEYTFTTQFLNTTGTTTNGSQIITGIPSTAGLDTTYMVTGGTSIAQGAFVQSVDSPTQVTLTLAATASGAQSLVFGKTKYTLPSDWDRQINRTHFDKSKRWEMLGPETAQQWQWIKSSYISTGPRIRYRILGGFFQTWPVLGSAELLGFEYISNGWVNAKGGSTSGFAADTETCVFPDRLMLAGLKRRYFELKGFDSSSFEDTWNRELLRAKAAEAGAPTLSMAPRFNDILIDVHNIADTGYGS